MRIDIMTDIETLGTKSDSTIIQIAAIAFDMMTGDHIATFNETVDIEKDDFLNVDGSTIKWWLNTNKELLHTLLSGGKHSSEEVLEMFHKWVMDLKEGNDVYLWGNGILFDNKMIQHQLEGNCLSYPIYYKNDRDVRTIVDLASAKLGISENELKERFNDDSLVEHDAFDDVKYQINLVRGCREILIG
jgi:hypothetical protein